MVSMVVTLREQADVRAVAHGNRAERLRATIVGLQATANRTQRALKALLEAGRAQGRVERYTPLWVFNGIAVTATPDFAQALASRPEVQSVSPDETITAPPPVAAASRAESNVSLVNAPALWDLGDRGQGVVVANMDTGVDAGHPDLASRWRGGSNSWYDPNGEHPATPTDVSGHGTATMGVMVGGDAGGTSIGIAPDARWIAVKIFNDHGSATTTRIHQGFQWLLDPDRNPSTSDAPSVVDNSWTLSNPGCSLEFQQDLRSLRAAGIVPVFAAGNYGSNGSTSASPSNNPEAFAVGATDNSDLIYAGSSRGPSACGETQTVFPELVAPGVDIRSSDLYGGYATSTGTSLSAPHAAGVLALLLSAFPQASADQQASALEGGAVDLGTPGPDNTFGYGRLDALAAFDWLQSHPDFSVSASPASASTLAGGTVTYTVSSAPANGFTGDVALSLAGLSASQASWAFTPPTIAGGSGSSQLSVTAAATLAPGSYPLTITATGGGLVRSTFVTLVVNPPPDFSISASPASAATTPGGRVSYAISSMPANGFNSDVTFSLAGLSSSQATWAFTPQTIAGGTGTGQLSVTAAASLAPGSYPLTINGTGGGLARSTSVTLVVNPPPAPDFALALTPASGSVKRGSSTTYTITVSSLAGFGGRVALSVSGLPSGAIAAVKPSPLNAPGTSTLTVKTTTRTAVGTFTLTVRGTSGALVHQATATFVVT
jgi:subtilisin family serine protease